MKEAIVDGITSARVGSKTLQKPSHTRQFLRQYFENVPAEDLEGRPEKLLARAAIDHLEFGATRRKGQALLRIFNQTEKDNGYSSPRTIVEMVNDDMPFLVPLRIYEAVIDPHGMHIFSAPRYPKWPSIIGCWMTPPR